MRTKGAKNKPKDIPEQILPQEQSAESKEIEQELTAKIQELKKYCTLKKIPFAAVFSIENNESSRKIVCDMNTPTFLGVEMEKDYITPILALIASDKFRIVTGKSMDIYDEEVFIAE